MITDHNLRVNTILWKFLVLRKFKTKYKHMIGQVEKTNDYFKRSE